MTFSLYRTHTKQAFNTFDWHWKLKDRFQGPKPNKSCVSVSAYVLPPVTLINVLTLCHIRSVTIIDQRIWSIYIYILKTLHTELLFCTIGSSSPDKNEGIFFSVFQCFGSVVLLHAFESFIVGVVLILIKYKHNMNICTLKKQGEVVTPAVR